MLKECWSIRPRPRADCFLDEKISTYEEAFLKVERRIINDSHIAVFLNNEECLIGELFYLFQEPDTYSIGWNFNAHDEGNGYASESAEALLRYLFTQKKARRVYATWLKIMTGRQKYAE